MGVVDERGAAEIVGLSAKTLQNKRVSGDGPPYVKLSPGKRGAVRYRVSDLESWLAGKVVHSTSERAPA